jgi:hypothetical protein
LYLVERDGGRPDCRALRAMESPWLLLFAGFWVFELGFNFKTLMTMKKKDLISSQL